MAVELHLMASPLSYHEWVKLNENWERIMSGFVNIQDQIRLLAGGVEVDEIIDRVNKAVTDAETTTAEMQLLIGDVENKLIEIQTAITNANNAADDANTLNVTLTALKGQLETLQTNLQGIVEAENTRVQNENGRIQAESEREAAEQTRNSNEDARIEAETARQQAEQSRVRAEQERETTFDLKMLTADEKIALMQELISKLKSYNYDSEAVYDFPNLIAYNGSTFIALQEVSGITPIDDGVKYRLVARKGVDGIGAVSSVNDVLPDENGNVELPIPSVIDNLESTSTINALSANQGRLIKALIDELETDKAEQTSLDETNNNVTNISNDLSTLSQTVTDLDTEVTAHLADIAYNVQFLGAKGDGITDDTDILQSIIDNAEEGSTIGFVGGTHIITSLTINKSLRFVAFKDTVLKFKDGLNQSAKMFNIINNDITVSFEGITFDGNKDALVAPNNSNSLYYQIISWICTSDNPNKSFLYVDKCKFINTPSCAIYLRGIGTQQYAFSDYCLFANVTECYFEKGFENAPGYGDTTIISFMDNVKAIVDKCIFIKNEDITLYGLSAVTLSIYNANIEIFASMTVRNCYFENYGRQGTSGLGGIGVVEFYASGEQIIIEGNKFKNSYFTPIRGKTNSKQCIIKSNIIDGHFLNANSTEISYGIIINRGTLFNIYGDYIIDNNIIKGIIGNGIQISGATANATPSGKAKDILIRGNIIESEIDDINFSRGIAVFSFDNCVIANNIIRQVSQGIYCNNYKLDIVIEGNQIFETSQYSIIFQGYFTDEPGYLNYDANVIIKGNSIRTNSIPSGFTSYRFIYFEHLSNIIITENSFRNGSAQIAQNIIRAGLNVTQIVASNNIAEGGNSAFFYAGAAALNGMNNINNGVLVQ